MAERDFDVLCDLLTRAGVVYEAEPETRMTPQSKAAIAEAIKLEVGEERTRAVHAAYAEAEPTGRQLLRIEEGAGPKNTGYGGFMTVVIFEADGTLVEWGTWE